MSFDFSGDACRPIDVIHSLETQKISMKLHTVGVS
jgi:hypothetical protein